MASPGSCGPARADRPAPGRAAGRDGGCRAGPGRGGGEDSEAEGPAPRRVRQRGAAGLENPHSAAGFSGPQKAPLPDRRWTTSPGRPAWPERSRAPLPEWAPGGAPAQEGREDGTPPTAAYAGGATGRKETAGRAPGAWGPPCAPQSPDPPAEGRERTPARMVHPELAPARRWGRVPPGTRPRAVSELRWDTAPRAALPASPRPQKESCPPWKESSLTEN